MTVAGGIEPCYVIKAHGVDDERIAFPLTSRVPEIGWIGVLRLFPAVQPNVSPNVSSSFVYKNDTFRKLEDFSWIGVYIIRGTPGGKQKPSGSSFEFVA